MTDEAAVARFEAFVHHQEPGAQWTPVTDYSLGGRRAAEGQHPELIRDVLHPKTVLDYGCGYGYLISFLRELSIDAEGYDPNGSAFRQYAPANARPHISGALWNTHRSDLVICREVLEHCTVYEAVQVVRRLVTLSTRLIYVTTRFAKAPDHLLSVETEFDVDPTHITCLTKPFLRTLFVLEGCRSRPDLEEKMDWQRKGRVLVFEVA